MAVISLRQIMSLRYIKQPTVDHIIAGLQFAKTSVIVNEADQQTDPPGLIIAAIDAAILALTIYKTVMLVIETLKALRGAISQSSKAGAAVMNPAMIAEMASDTAQLIAATAVEQAKQIPQLIIDMVLDYEFEV